MKIENTPIDSVVEYARNPRKNDGAVQAVAASIKEFGWKSPIVIDKNNVVVAGHTRLKAARKLGLTTVPTLRADDLTPQQVKAFRILDNKVAEKAEWDSELLEVELAEAAIDLELFDVDFSDDLDAGPGDVGEEDSIPDAPVEAFTKAGDLWLCGDHRVLCGDSTRAEDVARVMGEARPFIMVTDPPYGVSYDASWRNEAAEKGLISFAARREGRVENDDRVDWSDAYRHFPGLVAYVWHAGCHTAELVANLKAADFEIRSQIIWGKTTFAISRGHYHWQHEPCWYAVRTGSAKWCGDRSQSTLWEISNRVDQKDNTDHSTQKPLECMARPIRNHGDKADSVYDPFLGSGTTLIAAHRLGRTCYGIEISPQYCDVICKRFYAETGIIPRKETGELFPLELLQADGTKSKETRNQTEKA